MSLAPRNVVILGGGISGLTAAWALVRSAANRTWRGEGVPPPKIIVVDAGSTLGGCINTHVGPAATVLETGPRGLRPGGAQGRATLNLVASVGLQDQVLIAGADFKGAANRYVYTGGELKKLPSGFKELFAGAASGEMLPAALLAGVVKDAFLAKKADPRFYSAREAMEEKDESVFDFASRRLGKTVATFFIDPLCVGVFGGDARKLSLKSCFPILADFEAKEGSVVLGAIRQDVNTAPLPEPEPGTKRLLEYVDGARVWTLQRGMSSLTEGVLQWLERTGHVDIKTGVKCEALSKAKDGSITLTLQGGEKLKADHVISAVPANALAAILSKNDSATAAKLSTIPMQSIVVTNFVFQGQLAPVDGFGYLVPTVEPNSDILGVVFDSCTFPGQDDPYLYPDSGQLGEVTRITVMSGGYNMDKVYGEGVDSVDKSRAAALSLKALRDQIGITATPVHTNVMPWIKCMPQYTVGHANRVAAIHKQMDEMWGGALSVTGSSYTGVGVNDCVLNATRHAEELVAAHKA